MKVFIVYCHPSRESFTYMIRERLVKGLEDAGHTYIISDLYEMHFNESLSVSEYIREGFYKSDLEVPKDVLDEQQKINAADAIVFIYPVFWTEAPAKLVGWFQRVWTYGFAYGEKPRMNTLKKALFLVNMGGSLKDEIRLKQVEAMKCIMLGDRIHDRANQKEFFVFDEMTRGYGNDENRQKRIKKYLDEVYKIAMTF